MPYWPNADFLGGRSHNGPIARTVRDAALMLNVIAGPDPRDPVSLDLPPRDWVAECAAPDLRGLRVAWSPDFGYANVDPEVARVCAAAVRRFEELGCHVEEVTPGWENPSEWASLLWDFTFAARHMDRADEHPEWIEPTMLQMIDRGRNASAVELGHAQLARTALYEQARRLMERFDLLVTPQMPRVAWGVEEWPTAAMFDRLPFTYPFNLIGWPAACLPCGFNGEGLPIALQVVTGWHQDALCLRAAAAFEAANPGRNTVRRSPWHRMCVLCSPV